MIQQNVYYIILNLKEKKKQNKNIIKYNNIQQNKVEYFHNNQKQIKFR